MTKTNESDVDVVAETTRERFLAFFVRFFIVKALRVRFLFFLIKISVTGESESNWRERDRDRWCSEFSERVKFPLPRT